MLPGAQKFRNSLARVSRELTDVKDLEQKALNVIVYLDRIVDTAEEIFRLMPGKPTYDDVACLYDFPSYDRATRCFTDIAVINGRIIKTSGDNLYELSPVRTLYQRLGEDFPTTRQVVKENTLVIAYEKLTAEPVPQPECRKDQTTLRTKREFLGFNLYMDQALELVDDDRSVLSATVFTFKENPLSKPLRSMLLSFGWDTPSADWITSRVKNPWTLPKIPYDNLESMEIPNSDLIEQMVKNYNEATAEAVLSCTCGLDYISFYLKDLASIVANEASDFTTTNKYGYTSF